MSEPKVEELIEPFRAESSYKSNGKLTSAELHSLFDYHAVTGILKWKAGKEAGRLDAYGYRRVVCKGSGFATHRIAYCMMTGSWPDGQIDHIDGDRANNRWSNLRLATRSQNMMNRRIHKNNRSGHAGVSRDARKQKWQACIQAQGKMHYLGYFTELSDAVAARKAAEIKYHGEYRPNA